MTKKEKQAQALKALEYLAESVKEGDHLQFVEISTSNTGTTRMKVLKASSYGPHGIPVVLNLTYNMALALEYKFNRNDNTIVVPGCGYSKPQHLSDHLSYKLFGEEGKLGYSWI